MSGGAAKGLAHIGVLAVLERKGIPIDMIAGTSIGAIIGAFYAAGKDISQIESVVLSLSRRKMVALMDFTLPRRGFIKGKRVTDWLKSVIGDIDFDDLRIPFACVATDIKTGEEVVIKQGSVVKAARASSSIPVILTPAKWQGRYLVDGGLVNPVPVSVLREMGADFVMASNVIPHMSRKIQKANTGDSDNRDEPNILSVLMQVIHITGYQSALSGLREADLVITPNVAHIRPSDVNRARELILRGERAAQRAIPEIKRQLEA